MKNYSSFFFLFLVVNIFSQQKFSKEFSVFTDNDLYTSLKRDHYYTNGIFLSFRYLVPKKDKKLEKKILEWKVGHETFSPYTASVISIKNHDRPFAAYLYGSFGINKVYKNNTSFETSFQLGVLGPNAYGRELQDFIHGIHGFRKAIGWKFQIKSALGLNLNIKYSKFLIKNSSNSFDITWINSGKIGTVFTDIETGIISRFGFFPLQKLANSIAFKTNLNNDKTLFFKEIESFVFVKPSIRYSFYDATLQGSFLNLGSEVTNKLIPIVFNLEIGIKFTANRFNFGYSYNYNTNKSKGLKFDNGQTYGSINVSYLLK